MAKCLCPIDWNKTSKLELGSGPNPYKGYIHLDVSEFPDVEIICDLTKEKLPIEDNVLDEILANHVFEHLSWRRFPEVVKDCFRALKPGGSLVFRMPNLEFICRSYLEGKLTPEWPEDEKAMLSLYGNYSPSHWAIIKLFSGQDNPFNFHYACYDFEVIKVLLKKIGFTEITELKVREHSPGELQIQAKKPDTQFKEI